MLSKPILIEKINQGGISDSAYAGSKYSVAALTGFDLHSEPGILKVRQKLTKNSGSVVDEFCKVVVACSSGDIFWFSSTSGKIWKAGSPYTLVHTTTPVTGDAGCLGAYEYGGYIYWMTENRGHRIPVNATALADWTTYAEEDTLELNLDQDEIGWNDQTYALTTGIDEGATHKQTFTPVSTPTESIAINISAVGTGDWTMVIHNSANISKGSKTISNASLATGWNYFEFSSPLDLTKNASYHIHIYSTVADGTVKTDTASDFETGNIKIFRVSDSEFHPCLEHLGVLFIGDKNFVHQVEEQTSGEHIFTTEALDVPLPLRVKCLGKDPYNLLVGTIVSNNVARGVVFKWDTYSESFTSSDEVPEAGINAFIPADNYTFIHAGLGGSIYIHNGEQLELYKKIQGNYSPTATATIHPNAVAMFDGLSLFGLSNGTGNPSEQGVYALGHYSRDYPFVYDLSFPISERSAGELVTTGIEIGAMVAIGYDLYVAWKNGSTYGVDKLDYTAKLEKAYLESMIMVVERSQQQNFAKFVLGYRTLPASTSFTVKTQSNHAGSFTALSNLLNDTDRKIYVSDELINANVLQVRIEANVNSNDAPEMENFAVYLSQGGN